jgi:tRNA 2-thiocytidine biosynthesis protein TtcA
MKPEFNKNYGKWFINNVLKAISRYEMIESGEKIAVALSGGKDSITLLYILKYLKEFSHLKFELTAIHIKIFSDYNTDVLKSFCENLDVQYFETQIDSKLPIPEKSICYVCSRLKRGAISAISQKNGIKKVCYGHHANDVAETLLMNMIECKKLGSFSPRVEIPESETIIVRPMIYIEESIIRSIHKKNMLPLLEENCVYGECSNRNNYKELIKLSEKTMQRKNVALLIAQSLENIDYSNIWKQNSIKK